MTNHKQAIGIALAIALDLGVTFVVSLVVLMFALALSDMRFCFLIVPYVLWRIGHWWYGIRQLRKQGGFTI